MSSKLKAHRKFLTAMFIVLLLSVSFVVPSQLPSSAQTQFCPGNLLKNGDFTSFTLASGGNGNFPPSTVSNWISSSRTPQIAAEPSCGNPGHIRMWGNKAVGESISQTGLSIQAGHTYRLSACVKWPNTPQLPQYVRVNVRASNGVPPLYTTTAPTAPTIGIIGDPSNTPSIPAPGITSQSWTTITLADWTAPANFDTITLNPENDFSVDDGNFVSWVHLDNVCLVEVPPLDFKFTKVCEGKATTFGTSVPGPWNWNFGDGSQNSTQQSPTHTYATAGVYNVTLCAGNSTNCVTKPVTVNPGPPAPIITGPSSSCGNQTATYSVPATPGVSYSWNVNNGTINGPSNTNSINVTWNATGTGTISVTVTNKAGCSSSARMAVANCNLHLGECCTKFESKTDMKGLVHLGNGVYNFTASLSASMSSTQPPITRVTAEIISSSLTYSSPQCGKPGPVAGYVVSAGSVSGFTSAVPVSNGDLAIWWGGGTPVNGQSFPMQIKFPPPPTGACRDYLTFCVKYTFTTKDCKTCEVIRCYGPFKRGGPIKDSEELQELKDVTRTP